MRVFLRPNLARCIWVTPLVSGLFMTLALVVRHVFDMNPVWDPTSSPQQFLVIGYLSGLLGFMIGIGAFSTWWPWMIGAPTRPEDHSQHGAYSWRDYFKFNTDHKVIGVQYVVTTFIAFLIGGMMAEIFRSELAHPKLNFIKTASEFNGFLSQHGTLMIFTFLVPVFAGIGNYVIPLMIGAPDMAFPRLNALSFWLLPLALMIFLSSFIVGSFESGWTAYPPFSTRPNATGEAIFEIGVQVAGSFLDRDRGQLPRHHHHDARARHDPVPDAAAGLGQPGDLRPGRGRHAVHRRRPVHVDVRPRAGNQVLRAEHGR